MNVDVDRSGVVQLLHLLQSEEIYIIRRVDGLRGAVYVMGYWDTSSQNGVIFDIIDPGSYAIGQVGVQTKPRHDVESLQ